ncbi:MAG TPA: pyrimidine dimer DNA glycosylase/endonuclease V [Rhodanobacter sp.]
MRLWSLHPKYLDAQGLVALWREGLLAQAVLLGSTRGYTQHPQLERFKAHPQPHHAISAYLAGVHAEAEARGYSFNRAKIGPAQVVDPITVTAGQMLHEWQHLLAKLAIRNPALFEQWRFLKLPMCHPLFRTRAGPLASWERVSTASDQPSPKALRGPGLSRERQSRGQV